jgi:hypothetical protein
MGVSFSISGNILNFLSLFIVTELRREPNSQNGFKYMRMGLRWWKPELRLLRPKCRRDRKQWKGGMEEWPWNLIEAGLRWRKVLENEDVYSRSSELEDRQEEGPACFCEC